MQTVAKIPPAWTSWVQENLERGCHFQTIVKQMVDHKFDPVSALTCVLSEAASMPGKIPAMEALRQRLNSLPEPTAEWKAWASGQLASGCSVQNILPDLVVSKINPVSGLLWLISEAAKRSEQQAKKQQAKKQQALPVAATVTQPAHQPIVQGPVEQKKKTDSALALPQPQFVNEQGKPRFPESGKIIYTGDRDVQVRLRIAKPFIAILDNVLSDEECDELIRMARDKLRRSTVVDASNGSSSLNPIRTSSGCFLSSSDGALLTRIDERLADLMQMPVENGEALQILRYEAGQEYKPHHDYFDPRDQALHRLLKKGGQRVSTLVMYLSEVESGGETIFPSIGLSVVPKKGSALYFEYCDTLGRLDQLTLHGGAPVQAGEKWAATKWVRYRQYR